MPGYTSRKYVVLNKNSQGTVVASLVEAKTQKDAVLARWQLMGQPEHHGIFAVSNEIPSPWGAGGAYVRRATLTPPPPPDAIVRLGEQIQDLPF